MAFISYIAFSSAIGAKLRPLIALLFLSAALFGYKFSEPLFVFTIHFSAGYLEAIVLAGLGPIGCTILLLPTLVFYSKDDSADSYMMMCYWLSLPFTLFVYSYLLYAQIFEVSLASQIGMMFGFTYYLNTIVHSLAKEREESVINSIWSLLILGGLTVLSLLIFGAFFIKAYHADFGETFGHVMPENPTFGELLHDYNMLSGLILFTSACHILAVQKFFQMRSEIVSPPDRLELIETPNQDHRAAS